MTKHLVIAGVPRAGKSTVSAMLAKRYGYQHVSMDSIIAGFERCFPETGVTTYGDMLPEEMLRGISGKMAPFLQAMMDSGEYDEQEYGMVIDMYQLLPEDYVKHIDASRCGIAYFVTAEVGAEERFRLLKRFDTPKDYTYFESDGDNLARCREITAHSLLFREQCGRFHLPCFETSWDRERVLQEFVDSIALGSGAEGL